MSMFDTVHFACPRCGGGIAVQSKGSAFAASNHYSARRCPPEVLNSILGQVVTCSNNNYFMVCEFMGVVFRNAIGEGYIDMTYGEECHAYEGWELKEETE